MPRVAIIGTGYVGLASGACLASLGHQVTCIDVDEAKVAMLRRGEIPITEHRLDELVVSGLASGRLRFETSAAVGVPGNQFVFLCVPTPQGDDGRADLSYLRTAVGDIAAHLDFESIVINKSTVPVGSASLVQRLLKRPDVRVVSNPEFLREGTAVDDFLNPDRVVVGSDDPQAAIAVAALYGGTHQLLVTDAASAELIKYASNAFLAMRLSFVNSVADLCAAAGAQIDDVVLGLGSDHRIGAAFLKPGPGWGGSCFPKDTKAMTRAQEDFGVPSALMEATIADNARHIARVADTVVELAGGESPTVAVWGLTFKAGTDDLRDSPALAVVRHLLHAGCRVRAYDPTVSAGASPVAGIEVCATATEACAGAKVLVVLTEWDEFRWAEPGEALAALDGTAVYDTRNVLDAAAWKRAGSAYRGMGRR